VLPGAGLGDHAPLAHALHEQALAHDVVHLVRAGVVQVLTLHVDPGAAEQPGEVLAVRHRRRPARVRRHHLDVRLPERPIAPDIVEDRAQLGERLVEHFGHERTAELPVEAFAAGRELKEVAEHGRHPWPVDARRLRASGASMMRTSRIPPRVTARTASRF
jgi:hypothetical protein